MIWIVIAGVIVVTFGITAFFGAPYVPSQRRYVRRAFEQLYPLGESDTLVDIGSGDGLVLRIAARQFGARAVGYEIHPVFYAVSKWLSRRDKNVTVHLANFWLEKIPDETTVLYAFSVKRDNNRLIAKVQAESDRLQIPLTVLVFGSPFAERVADKQFEAYALYIFQPLQQKSLTV